MSKFYIPKRAEFAPLLTPADQLPELYQTRRWTVVSTFDRPNGQYRVAILDLAGGPDTGIPGTKDAAARIVALWNVYDTGLSKIVAGVSSTELPSAITYVGMLALCMVQLESWSGTPASWRVMLEAHGWLESVLTTAGLLNHEILPSELGGAITPLNSKD